MNNDYHPKSYQYKQFNVVINFNESDVNERYIYYNISYIKDNYNCHDLVIIDRDTKKLWFDWECSTLKPKSKHYYQYQRVVWNANYCKPKSCFKEFLEEIFYHDSGLIEVLSYIIFKKKNFNNRKFKEFLLKIYERESVERDLL